MDEQRLFDLSEMQHNQVSRAQARALGLDRWAIAHRVRRGEWDEVTSRVLRRRGAAPTPEESVMASVLHGGDDALSSHLASAWLWKVPGFGAGPTDIVLDRPLTSGRDPHRPRLELAPYRTVVRGVPVVSLPLTLFQLAGMPEIHDARLARVVSTIVGRAPSVLPVLDRTLEELAVRGRPGIQRMRAILADQDRSGKPTTGLERRFERILRHAGEAPMERQVDVGGHSWIGRVDYIDRGLLLIAEIDSLTFHRSHADKLRDAARDEALLAAGYRKVIRIAEEWVWYEPALALAEVRNARAELRANWGSNRDLQITV